MDKSISRYTKDYNDDYGFEAEMVRYRCQLVQERLSHYRPANVIELGCGRDLQAAAYVNAGGQWDSWTIVEPSATFAEVARQSGLPNLNVVQGFFEEIAPSDLGAADFILCSGLLHEVPDADSLMSAIAARMCPDTVVHLNVPNARSMHRQLAQNMGLIQDLTELSARNTTLQQPRVYDLERLCAQAAAHGLRVTETGGHLVKPFTHAQMLPLVESLGREVMDGLYQLGRARPDLASEIFIEARRA
ncbi:SAM-dependent methyltransferase [Candidatus Rhodobacter oscarellae]|uniref:SAM-dependent methyltransferase n=1 Tax=Candidatus Rhodobacter oscarellae TaxID=1675527 RepID=A0A0J9E6E9_9RHOB|nr:methyltransferase domain-containing protein [Candidatus Rhodobacter lobularis]KMW57404.1 SAM-dependent methyltransferase [Candidatus Rhodobacter lobularis]